MFLAPHPTQFGALCAISFPHVVHGVIFDALLAGGITEPPSLLAGADMELPQREQKIASACSTDLHFGHVCISESPFWLHFLTTVPAQAMGIPVASLKRIWGKHTGLAQRMACLLPQLFRFPPRGLAAAPVRMHLTRMLGVFERFQSSLHAVLSAHS